MINKTRFPKGEGYCCKQIEQQATQNSGRPWEREAFTTRSAGEGEPMCSESWDAMPRGLHFLYTSPASEGGDQWSSLIPHSSILPGQGYLEGQTRVAAKKRQFLHLCASPHIPGSFFLHILNSAFTSLITSLRQFPACQDSLRSLDSSTLSISGDSGMLRGAAWV